MGKTLFRGFKIIFTRHEPMDHRDICQYGKENDCPRQDTIGIFREYDSQGGVQKRSGGKDKQSFGTLHQADNPYGTERFGAGLHVADHNRAHQCKHGCREYPALAVIHKKAEEDEKFSHAIQCRIEERTETGRLSGTAGNCSIHRIKDPGQQQQNSPEKDQSECIAECR